MSQEHGVTLMESDMQEIRNIVLEAPQKGQNLPLDSVSVSYSLKDMEQIFFAGYYHPSIENSESEESLDNAFKKVIDRHNSYSR